MKNSATSVNIGSRIPTHQMHARLTLAELVLAGAVTEAQADELSLAVSERKNIAVVGSCGSGKTVLTQALLSERKSFWPTGFCAIVEDTPELEFTAQGHLRVSRISSLDAVEREDIIKSLLRKGIDSIVFDDVRSEHALDLVVALTSGLRGSLVTLIANGGPEALERLTWLAMQHPNSDERTKHLVRSAFDIVVHMSARKIADIHHVRHPND